MKFGETMAYIPNSGDLVWITFNPQAGHEQDGRRPALVLSPAIYNAKVGLAILCPITSQIKGYPFEVLIPDGLKISGAILSDQVKSLDWKARQAEFVCKLPAVTTNEVLQKLITLLT
ncbi:MAG: endoribonuclease MazF [Anaerolineaceae bacterium]|nr:endoribonuclease MazF [Anaerolineaceae bacterium]